MAINGLNGGYSAVSILGYANSTGNGIDLAGILGGASGSGGQAAISLAGAGAALAQAEKNEAKELAAVAKRPDVVKDIERYKKVVKAAKSIEDVLDDPVARKVFLKANGLGSKVDQVAMAKRALMSDPTDPKSVANRMASIDGNWLAIVKTYNFELFGVGAIQTSDSIKTITENYQGEVRLDMLDQRLPGLGTAMMFKKVAKNLDTSIKVLASPVGREVVTTALALPKQIALQSLEAQMKAIEQRIDPAKFKNSTLTVNKIAERYLIMLNGGTGGVTA